MENIKSYIKNWKIWSIILAIFLIILFIVNYNSLSKYETMEKFLDLVSESEYSKAKKYITTNFKWDLSAVKKHNLENAENFTYKYGDYYLENEYDIAYISNNIKETRFMSIYKFKLKQTIFGYKIDSYKFEYINY